METYSRVVPRDLFNEANFLNCLGKLYILTEGWQSIQIDQPTPTRFLLEQSIDGWLYSTSLQVFIHDFLVPVARPLNSREPLPLMFYHPEKTFCEIFTETGELSQVFVSYMHYLKNTTEPVAYLFCNHCQLAWHTPVTATHDCMLCGQESTRRIQ